VGSVGNLTIGIKLALDNKEMTGNLAISRDQLRAFAADMKRAAEAGSGAFGATRSALNSISRQLAEARNALLGYFSVMQAMRGAQAIIEAADGVRQLSARLKIATADAAEFARAQAGVFEIANRYGASLDETAKAFARLNPVIRQMGGGSAETLKMLDGLAASLKLSGATAAETSSVLLQFSQAMGSGKVSGDELRSMMENAEPLMRAVAQQMGKTTGELRQMAEQGLLTSQAFGNALLPAIDKLSSQAAGVPLGISQSMQVLRNELSGAFGREFEQRATGLSEAVRALSGHADTAAKAVRVLADGLVALGKVAAEVFAGAAIGGFVLAMSRAAAAVGALRTALAGVNTVMLGLFAGAAMQKLEKLSMMGKAGLLGLVFFGAYEITGWILEITRARAAITDLLTPVFQLVDRLRGIDRAKEVEAAVAAATAAAAKAKDASAAPKRLADPSAFARLTADLAYETRLREKHKQELIQLEQAYQDKLATLKDEAARKAFTKEYQEARRELMLKQRQEMEGILSKRLATVTRLPDLKKPMEDDLRAMQAALKTQSEIVETALAGRLVKVADYWQAKAAIDAQAFATEREKLSRELAAQEDLIARLSAFKPKDANQRAEIEQKLNEAKVAAANLRAELDALNGREVATKFRLEIDREKALREIRDAVAEAEAEIARMTGTETPEMRRAAIERAMRDMLDKLRQDAEGAALADRLIDLKAKEAELAAFERQWAAAQERMRTAELSANAQAQAGLITISQAQAMIAGAHREAAAAMEDLLPKMEAIANALGPEAVAKVEQWKTALLEAKNVVDPVASAINTDVKNAFATMFEQIGSGAKKAKEAIRDFALSVVASLQRIAAQRLAEEIFGGTGKNSGIGGFIAGLFRALGFASGGPVPGTGNRDSVPALLTPGEYVIRRDVAQRLGRSFLDAINGGAWIPRIEMGRLAFASGGAVPAVGGLGGVTVHVHNHAPASVRTETREDRGERIIDIIIEQITGAQAREIARGAGLAAVLERRYGLSPAAGALR
jgi:tape measure domain-containing protein